ncbi:MAG: hypothetical protein CBC25_02780 [Pelagibacteraceae bacterium TMED65]|nr:hypothetical protein [Rickettsiales bacterium]OUU52473.1 MAG: hypothetical protein CBC25_02780 [Pelagibacteraceae bacterium TMED65]|tara:strand:- start:9825 stop:10457 length:633 start_codon:yes stop_codon:yes gene_type:complete
MKETLLNKATFWQKKYKQIDFNPKQIFAYSNSKKDTLFSLSFFLSIMSIETLFNQPFRKKIKIVHNQIYKVFFKNKFNQLERIEINSFGFSLFLIFQKLFEEHEPSKLYVKDLIECTVSHWSCIDNASYTDFEKRYQTLVALWDRNKSIVLSRTYESRIDLIFLLYKSFELGIGDKVIIKKNLSVLIFSVSKALKEFRFDVLNELKKKKL